MESEKGLMNRQRVKGSGDYSCDQRRDLYDRKRVLHLGRIFYDRRREKLRSEEGLCAFERVLNALEGVQMHGKRFFMLWKGSKCIGRWLKKQTKGSY